MFGEEKNLKDSSTNTNIVIKDTATSISYKKTNKLVTALYMVTDIMDKDEPLRNKLRTLGISIISDISSTPHHASGKVSDTMSFLDIARTIGIISDMNYSILKKEFIFLDQSIREYTGNIQSLNREINLTELFKEEIQNSEENSTEQNNFSKGHYNSIGHHAPTRIGVQKGSTLLKALSDKRLFTSTKTSNMPNRNAPDLNKNNFDLLKKQRRFEIINMIKNSGGNATISDIKNAAQKTPANAESLVSCSEKTLQRELVSMISDGVLYRTGEKRWSKYSIK
ncbi:hypothetical protein IT399_00925 [Candidatus Nomurabacteria bacterium]|nr:hypothetical protein [Candidatus Nomurabacteria bacterium]